MIDEVTYHSTNNDFFNLVANANSYEWAEYATSKSANYYYDDIDVYKTDYWYDGMDIQETHYDITDYNIDDSMFFSYANLFFSKCLGVLSPEQAHVKHCF